MSEDLMRIPLPAIVFVSALIGCIFILCIIYQLLKRELCCQVKGREDIGEEEETDPFIEGEAERTENDSHTGIVERTGHASSSAGGGSEIEQPDGAMRSVDTTIDLSISDASFPSINLLPIEEEPVSTSGKLLLETTFSPVAKKMIISIVRAADVPGPERGGTAMVEVHLTILPSRKFKFRTRQKPAESPVFNEKCVLYPVTIDKLQEMSMRVRLYGRKKFGKKVLGELEIPMTEIDLHSDLSDEPMWKSLLPYGMVAPKPRPKSAASMNMNEDQTAELQISLHYISLTGRLRVDVIRGRNFQTVLKSSNQSSHVHILYLGPEGDCVTQSLTKRSKGTDPEFSDTFIFSMGYEEIPQVTLTFSVRTGNTCVGWFSLGRNYSGSREERHWNKLTEISDRTLRQWQKLLSAG